MSIPATGKEWSVSLTVATKELKPIHASPESNESARSLAEIFVILQIIGFTRVA
jgi:hypothetical protein